MNIEVAAEMRASLKRRGLPLPEAQETPATDAGRQCADCDAAIPATRKVCGQCSDARLEAARVRYRERHPERVRAAQRERDRRKGQG